MKVQTRQVTGTALDYAVALAEGFVTDGDKQDTELWLEHPDGRCGYSGKYNYSAEWSLCGPIIARERLNILDNGGDFSGYYSRGKNVGRRYLGSTILIAAMRCYIASKLGNEVEIPDGLF